ANEFVLQDDQGRTRAKLSVDTRTVALVFLGETGVQQLSLTSITDNSWRGHGHLAFGKGAIGNQYVLAATDPDEGATISDGGIFLSGQPFGNGLSA
ncbi:MAG: hypothetical protein WBW33_15655, partial [Bryobacteraceae bacterium]